jgi:hypothetical protein
MYTITLKLTKYYHTLQAYRRERDEKAWKLKITAIPLKNNFNIWGWSTEAETRSVLKSLKNWQVLKTPLSVKTLTPHKDGSKEKAKVEESTVHERHFAPFTGFLRNSEHGVTTVGESEACTARVFRCDSPPTRSRRNTGSGGEIQHADKGGEMSARIESKRMTYHNTPQLSRMDLANHCAVSLGLSLLNTRAVQVYSNRALIKARVFLVRYVHYQRIKRKRAPYCY